MRESIIITFAVGLVGLLGLYIGYQLGLRTIKSSDVKGKTIPLALRKVTRTDLTAQISNETTVFPGDPRFELEQITSLGEHSHFNLSKMTLCNHLGTHIDFPSHVIKDGKTSSDYSLDYLEGNGLIIEVPGEYNSISKSFIEQIKELLFENAIVFFKTRNSEIPKTGKAHNDFVYIEPDAARALLALKVKIVGIDYLSVDSSQAENLPVHKILLSNDVLIVEGLNLAQIKPGKCKLSIVPGLNIRSMDGLPTRVSMIR